MSNRVYVEGFEELEANFLKAKNNVKLFSSRLLADMSIATQEVVQGELQWNDGSGKGGYHTGTLHDSIFPDMEDIHGGVSVTIQAHDEATEYVNPVEEGSDPHFPPLEDLEEWATDHGTTAYVVARAIAEKGTEGRHMFAEGYHWISKKSAKFAKALGIEIVKQSFGSNGRGGGGSGGRPRDSKGRFI